MPKKKKKKRIVSCEFAWENREISRLKCPVDKRKKSARMDGSFGIEDIMHKRANVGKYHLETLKGR